LSPPWLSSISDFYSQFGRVFKEEWDAYCNHAKSKSLPTGQAPQLWKTNGDELIYIKELQDRRELYGCIDAWIRSLQSYRKELQKQGSLDVKGTCWFAGFPITNSEIVFHRDVSYDDDQFADDARLRQMHLREKWHESEGKDSSLVRDFIGPGIDTGFRLAALASPRKLVVSLDVAYLLATSHLPSGAVGQMRLTWFDIVYEGRIPLKGVLGGKPYPVFWIDVLGKDVLAEAEDLLSGKLNYCGQDAVKQFCENFFEENRKNMFKPFLVGETDEQYGEIPQNYQEFLRQIEERWAKEKARYETENRLNTPEQERGAEMSKADAKTIISRSLPTKTRVRLRPKGK
jgi:hypothetical protein